MLLPEFGVKRPITNIMIFAAVVVLAVYSLWRLSIDIMPEIEPPAISVITPYEGASPEDVESRVTEVIEDSLATTPNLDKLSSKSVQGISFVTCRFKWGTNLDEASNDIRDRIEFAKRFLPDIPTEIDTPRIFKFNTAMFPILFLGITAEESYPRLEKIVDDQIADEIEQIPGVGSTMHMGGLNREIHVYIDRARLEAYRVSLKEITTRLALENITMPAGTLKLGQKQYMIRIPAEFKEPSELNNIIVGKGENGTLIYLKDVATVEDGFKEPEVIGRMDGRKSMIFFVQKQWGANTVEVSRKVRGHLDEIKKKLPPDVKIKMISDNAEFIKNSIRNLSKTLFVAMLAVVVVTFLSLKKMRPSIVIAATIPFSLLAALIFFKVFGYTINTISLSSLAITVGMVVDNAIVITDNFVRHRSSGKDAASAAIDGASEMRLAVGASTLTTVVVFVPLIFTTGLVGIFFAQLGLTITVTLLASLFTALTFTPMLCSKVLSGANDLPHPNPPPATTTSAGPEGRLRRLYGAGRLTKWRELRIPDWIGWLEVKYSWLLDWSLKNKRKVIIYSAIVFVVSMALIPIVGTEFAPEEDAGDLRITAELPIGTRVEETARIAKKFEEVLLKIPEMRIVFARSGTPPGGLAGAFGQKTGSNMIMCGGKLVKKSERSRSNKEVADELRREFEKIPGLMKLTVDTADPMAGVLMGGGKKIQIEISGYSFDETNKLAERIKQIAQNIKGAVDVTVSRDIGEPTIVVTPDKEKAASLGITTKDLTDAVGTFFQGTVATRLREGGDQYDIRVRLREEDRQTIDDVKNVIITSPYQKIRLFNVADVSEAVGPVEIERKNRQRVVKVEANTYKRAMGDVVADMKREIAGVAVPEGISVNFGGEAEEQVKAFKDLFLLLILGIILVYMVMASQFESLLDPFVIMFSVPFTFAGVVWAFLVTGTTLSIVTFLGIVMLMGIVVNNAIVLVSYIEILRERGEKMLSAIVTAGKHRLRPILMTTLTTLIGTLPLAIGRGEGAEIWRPLGITMLGGLTVSTFASLILVPVLYVVFNKKEAG